MVGYKSGTQFGKVITVNDTVTLEENNILTTLTGVVKANYGALIGDSGAPIIEAITPIQNKETEITTEQK